MMTRKADFRQEQCFISCLPLMENKEEIKDYLSICFQKQNGALTIIADKKIDEQIIKKLVKLHVLS